MTSFLDAILAFPTVCFTILLGVMLSYWFLVIAGAVGIDVLDGDVDLSAGAKAAGGALEGGAKAASGLLEGGAKAASGMLEGGAKAVAGHAVGEHLSDAADGAGLLAWLGLGGVPVTVSSSFIIFFSWLLSVLGAGPAHEALGSFVPSLLINLVVGLLCFVLGTLGASVLVRPLRPIFIAKHAPGRQSLMGRVCVISSGSVTSTFGQATYEDGGAGLILNVVWEKPNQLQRGHHALILGYDAARDVYEVEPVDWLLPEETEQLRDPARAAALARARGRVR